MSILKVNDLNINNHKDFIEISYNLNGEAAKEYCLYELLILLNRIPLNLYVLYDTGSVWCNTNDTKYVFDTFADTDVFNYDFSKNENVNEHIFSLIGIKEYAPIKLTSYLSLLDQLFSKYDDSDYIVEYLHLVLIKKT